MTFPRASRMNTQRLTSTYYDLPHGVILYLLIAVFSLARGRQSTTSNSWKHMRRFPLQVNFVGSRIRKWLSGWELWRCLAINYFGVLCYLFFASWFWDDPTKNIPQLRIISPKLWFYSALPILAVCGVANLAWTLTQLIRCVRKRSLVCNPFYLGIPLVWAIALIVDYINHERF